MLAVIGLRRSSTEPAGGLMGRRIRWLGVIMVVCLGLVVAQLVNIQLVKAKQLQNSPNNPRVAAAAVQQPPGDDPRGRRHRPGQVGPDAGGHRTRSDYPYDYVRRVPPGPAVRRASPGTTRRCTTARRGSRSSTTRTSGRTSSRPRR